MVGNLNLKESWEPSILSNQKRTYQAEQRAIEERKKTQERLKKLQQERQIEELQQMHQVANGSQKCQKGRLDDKYNYNACGQRNL